MMTGSSSPALNVSFEFFPPKSEKMEKVLWHSIERLAPLRPTFVSVTYGAGGSTRERTHRTVQALKEKTTLHPAAHLTCVNASKADVDAVVDSYRAAGINHIVALRGDPPDGVGTIRTPPIWSPRSVPGTPWKSPFQPIPNVIRRARTGRRRSTS